MLDLLSAFLAFALATLALVRPGIHLWQVVVTLTILSGVLVIGGRKAHRTPNAELAKEPTRVPSELSGGIKVSTMPYAGSSNAIPPT